MALFHQQRKVYITCSEATPYGVAGIGKQCGVFFCRIPGLTWHCNAEHKAQHRGSYKPVGADTKALLLRARTWSYANGCIIFVTYFV